MRILSDRLPVLEVFGPTIQGEGAMMGVKVMFVRLAGCDFSCVWCDSKFTWDGSEKPIFLTPEQIIAELKAVGGENFSWVTISGGNPALFGDPLRQLIERCHATGYKVSIETQGSRWQDWLTEVDEVVVSPKPPSSSMSTDDNLLKKIIAALTLAGTKFSLKIVVFDDNDYQYARKLRQQFAAVLFFLQVGNEEVDEPGSIALRLLKRFEWLVNLVIADHEMNDVKVLPQLHTLVWGNKRAK